MSPRVNLPHSWASTTLEAIRVDESTSLDPSKSPSECFELYSIPAFPSGHPEIVKGEEIGSTKKTLAPGTVVVSKINPRINRVWIVGERTRHRQIGSSEWIPFFPIEGIEPKYLAYYMRQDAFRNFLAANVSGVGGSLMRVRPATVDPYPFLIAPTPEQHRIVSAIESYITRLDDATATLERVQRNLKRYRASVLKAAVEGRIVPTEAELARAEGRDYEHASVLLDRILVERRRRWEEAELAKMTAKGKVPKNDKWKAKYKEPVAPDTSDLPELPEGWCWVSIDQVVVNHDRDRVPVKRADRAKRQGAFPYYGASGTIDTIDDYLFDGEYLLVGEDGANLLARSTPIAFQAHGRFWVNNHAHVLQTSGGVPLGYIEILFNSTDLARFVTGTAQPKLPQAAMNKIPVPLSPLAEQSRILESVERLLSIDECTRELAGTGIRRSLRLRQSILKWAFEGKLADQDPNDEPASVLLERIKAEREFTRQRRKKA